MTPKAPVPLAFVMSSFAPGGTERQMIELARRLDPARWDVHIACFRAEGDWYDRAAAVARSVVEFPVRTFKSPELLRQIVAFARWCRARRIEVVHTVDLPSNIFGQPGAAFAGVTARIANRREINPGRSLAELALQRLAYACAHRVIANSRAAAERLRVERVPARKISVVPNGLDTSLFDAPPANTTRRTVTVVANLRPEKGHDVLVDAAPAILARFPDARFELIGGGTERAVLQGRTVQRGVQSAFAFAGHCENVAARLRAAGIFVLPSRSDASPNAVVEAMAAGLPIVASSVGGIVELVEHDVTGLLVPPDDPGALSHAICRLMDDESLAARLGAAARERALTRHSFERMVAAFDEVYTTALGRRSAEAFALQPNGNTSHQEREGFSRAAL